MYKKLITLTLALFLLSSCSLTPQGEILNCEITSLDEYGFVQVSEHKEYVCYNTKDFTDFLIIEDKKEEYKEKDKVKIVLNEENEILSHKKIK